MDEFTVRVMSNACKMADITDEGVSLVEDLKKKRQPLPSLDAIYYIQPTRDSIRRMRDDMSGANPLYKRAYVFYSSPVSREYLQAIKGDPLLIPRIAAMKEVNLEYLTIDTQGFVTDHGQALEHLYGQYGDGSQVFDRCLEGVASRLATVFASVKEFPLVRYRAARAGNASPSARDLVSTRLASMVWDRLMKYRASLPNFPQQETCDLIILDRSFDPVAPVIHEWTYDCMCHDLLPMEGSKYRYEVVTSSGAKDVKDVLLEEHDPVWLELRDLHIADAGLRLDDKMQQFGSTNKAAQMRLGGQDREDISTRDMQKMVQVASFQRRNALPQYREQLDKLSLHIHVSIHLPDDEACISRVVICIIHCGEQHLQIATSINARIKEEALVDVGKLEQDLVFGDATSKELLGLLTTNPRLTQMDKLRLLMIYAVTHPEKLDSTKRVQWMKLAKLSEEDMRAVDNLEFLGVSVAKKAQSNSSFSLKFGARKQAKRPMRRERTQDEEAWSLSRFYPLVQDVVEDLAKGDLPKDEYPYVKEPSAAVLRGMASVVPTPSPSTANAATTTTPARTGVSMRTSARTSWASKSKSSDDSSSNDSSRSTSASSRTTAPELLPSGRRLFVFVIGGMTRSEVATSSSGQCFPLRAAHKMSAQLQREVIFGSTTLDDPHKFITDLSTLLHHKVVVLEAKLQKVTPLKRCMRARHGDNLGLLGHQVVGSLPCALEQLKCTALC
eukprot:SM000086S23071  [mRNA]  locus=s86:483162:489967:+ [translate_table: standard]